MALPSGLPQIGDLGREIDSIVASQRHNIVINGNLNFWQRGTSFSHAGGSLMRAADRFNFWVGSAMASTFSRQSPTVDNSGYIARIQRNAGVTTSTNIQITHHIDMAQAQMLAGKKVMLSFYARKGANFSPTFFRVQICTGTAATETNLITGGFTGRVDQELNMIPILTTTMQRFTLAVTLPANTQQLALNFYTDNYVGTAGAADYYELEKVMLQEGWDTAPFKMFGNSIGEELIACQRYYEKSYSLNVAPGASGSQPGCLTVYSFGSGVPNASGITNIRYSVPKRAGASVVIYSYGGTPNQMSNGGGFDIGSIAADFSGESGFRIRNSSGGTFAATEFLFHYVADAEL